MASSIPSFKPETPTSSVGFPVEGKYTYDPTKDYFSALADVFILMIVDLIGPTPEDLRAFTLVNRRIYAISSDRSHFTLERHNPRKKERRYEWLYTRVDSLVTDEYIYSLASRYPRLKTITTTGEDYHPSPNFIRKMSDRGFCYLIGRCKLIEKLALYPFYVFTDDSLLCLSHLKTLKSVSFISDEITDSGVFTLTKACSLLEFISLDHCNISTRSLSHIGINCRRIKDLSVTLDDPKPVEISDYVDNHLPDVARGCSQLEVFNCQIAQEFTDVGMKLLAEGCTKLRELIVSGDVFLSFVGLFPNLKKLSISNEEQVTSDQQMIMINSCCPRLEELALMFFGGLFNYSEKCIKNGLLLPNKFQTLRDISLLSELFISIEDPEAPERFIRFILLNCPILKSFAIEDCTGSLSERDPFKQIPALQLLVDRNVKVLCNSEEIKKP